MHSYSKSPSGVRESLLVYLAGSPSCAYNTGITRVFLLQRCTRPRLGVVKPGLFKRAAVGMDYPYGFFLSRRGD